MSDFVPSQARFCRKQQLLSAPVAAQQSTQFEIHAFSL
jgi:hypothetical protein